MSVSEWSVEQWAAFGLILIMLAAVIFFNSRGEDDG